MSVNATTCVDGSIDVLCEQTASADFKQPSGLCFGECRELYPRGRALGSHLELRIMKASDNLSKSDVLGRKCEQI